MAQAALTGFRDDAGEWDKALYAFLVSKRNRSGSMRTVQGYSGMLTHFFGLAGKPPDRVSGAEVFAWANGPGISGRQPSTTTVGARIACLSSFYRFLIRMELVQVNPCDRLERPKARQSIPRGLAAEDIRKLLAVVPETREGLRDGAIILTLVLTGRRRAEVLGLAAGDLSAEGSTTYYQYRGKGGKSGRRELPQPAYDAIVRELAVWGKSLECMRSDESLWPTGSDARGTKGITSGTFYLSLRRYLRAAGLPMSGVHVFRHTAAKLRRDAGESVEDVSMFLDHSSLAVTSVYLRRLEGQRDKGWSKVAEAIGV